MDERKKYDDEPTRTSEDEQPRTFASEEQAQPREELPFHIPRD